MDLLAGIMGVLSRDYIGIILRNSYIKISRAPLMVNTLIVVYYSILYWASFKGKGGV